ncbi:hypothetical protein DRW41_17725 [Neobacillus piezotolerans]|uniref:Uncharacterized protein n=1 Tax=Neobacillus piezotolerans TaxID=2259171 RepID=A0A3D8GMZ2_9BACI|nr:hypothetical protein DRW41_17725 [Neobacillus piezotolerans]
MRVFFLLTGFGFSVSGGISLVAYLNVFAAGMGYLDYFQFISSRPECYLLPAGMAIVALSIFLPGRIEDD